MPSPEPEEPRHLVGDAAAERPSKQLVGTMGLDLAQRLDVGGGHLSDAFVERRPSSTPRASKPNAGMPGARRSASGW